MTPDFMNAPAYFFHWNIFSVDIYISAANLLIIALMILVFVLALLLPFPGGRRVEP
jgi:hypothetical protein